MSSWTRQSFLSETVSLAAHGSSLRSPDHAALGIAAPSSAMQMLEGELCDIKASVSSVSSTCRSAEGALKRINRAADLGHQRLLKLERHNRDMGASIQELIALLFEVELAAKAASSRVDPSMIALPSQQSQQSNHDTDRHIDRFDVPVDQSSQVSSQIQLAAMEAVERSRSEQIRSIELLRPAAPAVPRATNSERHVPSGGVAASPVPQSISSSTVPRAETPPHVLVQREDLDRETDRLHAAARAAILTREYQQENTSAHESSRYTYLASSAAASGQEDSDLAPLPPPRAWLTGTDGAGAGTATGQVTPNAGTPDTTSTLLARLQRLADDAADDARKAGVSGDGSPAQPHGVRMDTTSDIMRQPVDASLGHIQDGRELQHGSRGHIIEQEQVAPDTASAKGPVVSQSTSVSHANHTPSTYTNRYHDVGNGYGGHLDRGALVNEDEDQGLLRITEQMEGFSQQLQRLENEAAAASGAARDEAARAYWQSR